MLSKWRMGFLLALFIFPLTTALAQQPKTPGTKNRSVYTAVFSHNPKDCQDVDVNTVSEGEDVPQLCKGYGTYRLYRTSAVYRVNLSVQDSTRKFTVPVIAAENEEANALENHSVKKFGDKIEWLVENGKPFAFIVRVSYYKDTNDEQTVFKAQNRIAEYLFVRGLKGFEALQYEVSVTNTPYNANEQARMLAYRFYEEHQ